MNLQVISEARLECAMIFEQEAEIRMDNLVMSLVREGNSLDDAVIEAKYLTSVKECKA